MRMPKENECLIGKVCVSGIGRVGIVTSKQPPEWSNGVEMWCGIGFDGKGTWASSDPAVIAENAELFRHRLSKFTNGKMSYLD